MFMCFAPLSVFHKTGIDPAFSFGAIRQRGSNPTVPRFLGVKSHTPCAPGVFAEPFFCFFANASSATDVRSP
jgi:hypothetical protein